MMTLDVKSSDDDCGGVRGRTLADELLRNRHTQKKKKKHGTRRKRPGEETSGEELEGLRCEGLTLIEICVTFLCAQSRERERRGERRESARGGGRGSEIERERAERSEIPVNDSCLSHQAN